ncbi:hypothetical protein [Pseudarthrobacter sp. NPDC058119]|uniref:hypothetical protein n=1 Tax=Pseudarthrobacter sp. NPDC058119 TaxID=3346348 RepID=UPI0036DCE8A0
MRRNSLLTAATLSALLATTACGAVSGTANPAAPSTRSASAGLEATAGAAGATSSDQVGASQRMAAERVAAAARAQREAADAKKAQDAAAAEAAAKAAAADAAAKAKADAPATAGAPVQAQAAAPVPTTASPQHAAAPAAPAPGAQPGAERIVPTTYTTAYTWFDNTPAGSATISHPVLHQSAGGTGTFEDPITIAVGHSLASGHDVLDFPAGTRIYLPDVRRYFIVEDTCGDGNEPQSGPCHQGANANGTNSTIWIDMWIGGQGASAGAADDCASRVTNVNTAVFNPASNYAVAPGAGVIHDGKCDAGYGNALVKK